MKVKVVSESVRFCLLALVRDPGKFLRMCENEKWKCKVLSCCFCTRPWKTKLSFWGCTELKCESEFKSNFPLTLNQKWKLKVFFSCFCALAWMIRLFFFMVWNQTGRNRKIDGELQKFALNGCHQGGQGLCTRQRTKQCLDKTPLNYLLIWQKISGAVFCQQCTTTSCVRQWILVLKG